MRTEIRCRGHLLAAHRTDHGSGRPCRLHQHRSDPARRRGDEHRLTRAYPHGGQQPAGQLVEQIFDEAFAELTAAGSDRPPGQRWQEFLAHIEAYHRLYGALLGRRGSPWFADRMRAAVAAMVSEHLPGQGGDALAPAVVSAMFMQSIVWWLDDDRPYPPAELAERSAPLIGAVLETAGGATG
ncbi:TetR-like C-terminal domain-containing protein [Nocardia sp. NPDC059239]|uniref:TetR-like C-terminal domain-containing protein n=1 Tax=unclassified Nocardia TaxID=2637762 RepID=UPI003694653A